MYNLLLDATKKRSTFRLVARLREHLLCSTSKLASLCSWVTRALNLGKFGPGGSPFVHLKTWLAVVFGAEVVMAEVPTWMCLGTKLGQRLTKNSIGSRHCLVVWRSQNFAKKHIQNPNPSFLQGPVILRGTFLWWYRAASGGETFHHLELLHGPWSCGVCSGYCTPIDGKVVQPAKMCILLRQMYAVLVLFWWIFDVKQENLLDPIRSYHILCLFWEQSPLKRVGFFIYFGELVQNPRNLTNYTPWS